MIEGDTQPLAVFRLLNGTQYVNGRYTVRTNLVISYADIIVYFEKSHFFIKKHNKIDIQSKEKLFKKRARFAHAFCWVISAFFKLEH